jgi:hypothetical protein
MVTGNGSIKKWFKPTVAHFLSGVDRFRIQSFGETKSAAETIDGNIYFL